MKHVLVSLIYVTDTARPAGHHCCPRGLIAASFLRRSLGCRLFRWRHTNLTLLLLFRRAWKRSVIVDRAARCIFKHPYLRALAFIAHRFPAPSECRCDLLLFVSVGHDRALVYLGAESFLRAVVGLQEVECMLLCRSSQGCVKCACACSAVGR